MTEQDETPMLQVSENDVKSDNNMDTGDNSHHVVEEHHEVDCPHIGKINVYVQGSRASNSVAILTVHDLGCDHTMYHDFIRNERMTSIRDKTLWVHVDIPGQSREAPDLPPELIVVCMVVSGLSASHSSGKSQSSAKELTCFKGGPKSPECPRLKSPANGKIITSAQLVCDDGYIPDGNDITRCGQNGKWTDSLPCCVDPCDLKPCKNGSTCGTVGSDYTCVCAEGFKGVNCNESRICYQFDGSNYFQVTTDDADQYDYTMLVRVKTSVVSASIFYTEEPGKGYLISDYDNDIVYHDLSAQYVIVHGIDIRDGIWHTVNITKFDSDIFLEIDGVFSMKTQQTYPDVSNGVFYLGGYPPNYGNEFKKVWNSFPTEFVGCLELISLEINGNDNLMIKPSGDIERCPCDS